eukprot:2719943-Ditylum_brightwellii.AAC.1
MKKQWHTDAVKYHPDKNPYKDAAEIIWQCSDTLEKVENAYTCLYGQHVAYAGGISERLNYGRRCDTVRMSWQVKVHYNDDIAKVQFANMQKEEQKKDTITTKKECSNVEKCTSLYLRSGQQTNDWKHMDLP